MSSYSLIGSVFLGFWGSATYTYLEEESLCPLSTGFQVGEFRGAFPLKSQALPGAVFNLSFFSFFCFPQLLSSLSGQNRCLASCLTTSVHPGGGSVCLQWRNRINLLLEVLDEMINAGSSLFLFISLDRFL